MRQLFIIAALTSAVTLGGCSTLNYGDIPGIITNVITTGRIPSITPDIDAKINEAVAKARTFAIDKCGYLPAVSTVTDILAQLIDFTTAVPASTIERAVIASIESICNTVTRSGARRGGAILEVRQVGGMRLAHGVPVQGRFVR